MYHPDSQQLAGMLWCLKRSRTDGSPGHPSWGKGGECTEADKWFFTELNPCRERSAEESKMRTCGPNEEAILANLGVTPKLKVERVTAQ